jgi:hypothetical protein
MILDQYPIFEGLSRIDTIPLREMPVVQAREYFKWFKRIYSLRIIVLLDYFAEHLTGDLENDLLRLGQRVAEMIPLEQFSQKQEKGYLVYVHEGKECRFPPRRTLTLAGRSIGTDMGCLMASCILSLNNDVKWHMPTRPKRYIDLHQPTLLVPGDKIPFNPVISSISCCGGIANSELYSDIWCDRYRHYRDIVKLSA